jgi:hypothetical protein
LAIKRAKARHRRDILRDEYPVGLCGDLKDFSNRLTNFDWNWKPIEWYSPNAQLVLGRWKSAQVHFDLEASVAVFELGGAGSFKARGGTVRAQDMNFIIAVRTAEGESDPKAEARAGKIDLAWTG